MEEWSMDDVHSLSVFRFDRKKWMSEKKMIPDLNDSMAKRSGY